MDGVKCRNIAQHGAATIDQHEIVSFHRRVELIIIIIKKLKIIIIIIIIIREGAQQGYPMGSLEFCEATHLLLINLQSAVKIGFMDDITLAGDVRTVEADVSTI